jgi:hypothetical protein
MPPPLLALRTAVRGNEDAHGTRVDFRSVQPLRVMPGLVPGIHAVRQRPTSEGFCSGAAWMTGTSPVMTRGGCRDFLPCNRFGFPGQPCACGERAGVRGVGVGPNVAAHHPASHPNLLPVNGEKGRRASISLQNALALSPRMARLLDRPLALEHDAFKSKHLGRHREQSEAIQTRGLRQRLSLDRFAVARDDGRNRVNLKTTRPNPHPHAARVNRHRGRP